MLDNLPEREIGSTNDSGSFQHGCVGQLIDNIDLEVVSLYESLEL